MNKRKNFKSIIQKCKMKPISWVSWAIRCNKIRLGISSTKSWMKICSRLLSGGKKLNLRSWVTDKIHKGNKRGKTMDTIGSERKEPTYSDWFESHHWKYDIMIFDHNWFNKFLFYCFVPKITLIASILGWGDEVFCIEKFNENGYFIFINETYWIFV